MVINYISLIMNGGFVAIEPAINEYDMPSFESMGKTNRKQNDDIIELHCNPTKKSWKAYRCHQWR